MLVNFYSLIHLRYYTHMLKVFLASNHGEIPEAYFVSIECKRITFPKFINKVMSIIYSMIFNASLSRVLEDMKIHLQLNIENRVGDWVLFMHLTMIWVIWFSQVSLLFTCFLNSQDFFS
jgi:hypothetical protein